MVQVSKLKLYCVVLMTEDLRRSCFPFTNSFLDPSCNGQAYWICTLKTPEDCFNDSFYNAKLEFGKIICSELGLMMEFVQHLEMWMF